MLVVGGDYSGNYVKVGVDWLLENLCLARVQLITGTAFLISVAALR